MGQIGLTGRMLWRAFQVKSGRTPLGFPVTEKVGTEEVGWLRGRAPRIKQYASSSNVYKSPRTIIKPYQDQQSVKTTLIRRVEDIK